MGYLKNELSEKSKYHLSKHRYLELKHFCLQYPEWKEKLREINDISAAWIGNEVSGDLPNETERLAIERAVLTRKIDLVEQTCMKTDKQLWFYILVGVTEEQPFVYLQNMMDIPCGKNMYYDRYRRFYWLMDQNLQGV